MNTRWGGLNESPRRRQARPGAHGDECAASLRTSPRRVVGLPAILQSGLRAYRQRLHESIRGIPCQSRGYGMLSLGPSPPPREQRIPPKAIRSSDPSTMPRPRTPRRCSANPAAAPSRHASRAKHRQACRACARRLRAEAVIVQAPRRVGTLDLLFTRNTATAWYIPPMA
jgi:hypothetical protein